MFGPKCILIQIFLLCGNCGQKQEKYPKDGEKGTQSALLKAYPASRQETNLFLGWPEFTHTKTQYIRISQRNMLGKQIYTYFSTH